MEKLPVILLSLIWDQLSSTTLCRNRAVSLTMINRRGFVYLLIGKMGLTKDFVNTRSSFFIDVLFNILWYCRYDILFIIIPLTFNTFHTICQLNTFTCSECFHSVCVCLLELLVKFLHHSLLWGKGKYFDDNCKSNNSSQFYSEEGEDISIVSACLSLSYHIPQLYCKIVPSI